MRPALIVSRALIAVHDPLYFAVMITSASHRRWPDDIALDEDYAEFGLPRPSLIRVAKIASIGAAGTTVIGALRGDKLAAVRAALAGATGLNPPAAPAC